jgi:hypothetical protein
MLLELGVNSGAVYPVVYSPQDDAHYWIGGLTCVLAGVSVRANLPPFVPMLHSTFSIIVINRR